MTVPQMTSDDMARGRTILAADRTLMAWMRTTLSMISFGFTIYSFLQAIYEANKLELGRLTGPRNLGLALILLGVTSLGIACVQYVQELKRLGVASRLRLPLVVSAFVVLLGILALVDLLFRIRLFF